MCMCVCIGWGGERRDTNNKTSLNSEEFLKISKESFGVIPKMFTYYFTSCFILYFLCTCLSHVLSDFLLICQRNMVFTDSCVLRSLNVNSGKIFALQEGDDEKQLGHRQSGPRSSFLGRKAQMSESELVSSIFSSRSPSHHSPPCSLPLEPAYMDLLMGSHCLCWVWPIESTIKRPEGGKRALAEQLLAWAPSCGVDSVPLSRNLWSFQGVFFYMTFSLQIPVTTAPLLLCGIGMVTVRLLSGLGDSSVYCGSPIAMPL